MAEPGTAPLSSKEQRERRNAVRDGNVVAHAVQTYRIV
jgi:hypothetical protein